jgi:hypothetical protein
LIFVKTTPFDPASSALKRHKYQYPPKRLILEEYVTDLQSALFTRAGEKLVEFESEIGELKSRLDVFINISFGVLAIIVSALAIIATEADQISISAAFWGAVTIVLSVAAFLIALLSFVNRRIGRLFVEQYGRVLGGRARAAQRFLRRAWWIGLSITLALTFVASWGLYTSIAPFFSELRKEHVLVASDLDDVRRSLQQDINELSARLRQLENRDRARPDGAE